MFHSYDSRYIVLLQTKNHNSFPPMYNVSYMSLAAFLGEVYIRNEEYYFRSMSVKKEDIITFAVYELTFSRYKTKAIETSELWKKLYSSFLPNFLVDFILYFWVYRWERDYYGNTITNNKPKYFDNIRDEIVDEMITRMTKKVTIEYLDNEIIINKRKLDFKNNNSLIRDIIYLYFESVPDWETKSLFTNMEKYYKNNID